MSVATAQTPVVLTHATMRDEDSTIILERIRESEGDISIAVWGTEDVNPDAALAYTLVPEEDFIALLEKAGYEVTRKADQ